MSDIFLKNVKLSFERQAVLDIPLLKIGSGVKLAVIGESGSGKSTLLNCLCALERVDSGEIYYDGVSLNSLNEFQRDAFRGKNIGLIMQDFYLYEGLSALDNVLLPTRLSFGISTELKERALFLLSSLNIKNYLQRVDTLSRGEKQRVAIARALLNDPEVIVADEPTASLDAKNSAEVSKLLLKISDETNKTFICVTHNLVLANSLQFKLELKKGKKIEAIFEC
ncbi:MAG: ATP-binding cassette domain-containing protein [Campylobacteraceae bacterium]|jgi:putative ABC transport system ATP-binding protein|nr:ATP-binding cassette domain-containing protein [Campylobacteraceae bacterium]